MKVLLDECVPANFAKHLVGHDCITAPSAGFAGMKNEDLLAMAERLGFEVFITIDQGIAHQQNLSGRSVAILVLQPRSSRLSDLAPLVHRCLQQLQSISRGELRFVSD